ncbi:MAG: RNA-binding cell elongation regulator Jag/EloR [Candidatus Cloacimonadota bacterium]|nr:RNA-binding cell elongation regulator Jag/EloR [Candidatus Cloacimonadota bacterium]
MKTIVKTGKSTSAIIAEFMQEYNVKMENIKFEVIEEGSKGFLKLFGSKPTKIKFNLPDIEEKVKEYTETVLKLMKVKYKDIVIENPAKDTYKIEINGVDDAGFLIGKEGKLLNSMQHLLNQMINKYEKRALKLKIDVDNYRDRRKNALLDKVASIAEKAKKRGKSITLEPLHSYNRRLVHQYIEKDKDVRTMTIGEGHMKRIVIMPNKKKTSRGSKQKKN